jgi:hypothetical protein
VPVGVRDLPDLRDHVHTAVRALWDMRIAGTLMSYETVGWVFMSLLLYRWKSLLF